MKPRLPTLPLFAQALGLVLAALVAAEIATVAVVLSLPPPPPDVYTVADVAQAVHHQGRTQTRDGRDLTAHLAAAPPARSTEGHRRLQFRAALAAVL
ncbi:MAG: ATP-binding protein, partial [Caulobacteraceae bacterium]